MLATDGPERMFVTAGLVHCGRTACRKSLIRQGCELCCAFLQVAPWDARRHWKHAVQDPCMRSDAAGALLRGCCLEACDDAQTQLLLSVVLAAEPHEGCWANTGGFSN
jgi:hypothetical protein